MMCAIIEDLLPASYFSTTLLGVQTDQRVLRHLIVQYLPRLDKLLQEHDIGETWLPSSPRFRDPKMVVPPLSSKVSRQRRLMWLTLLLSFCILIPSHPFPSLPLPSPLLLFGSWPVLAQADPTGVFGVCWQSCLLSRCTGSSRPSPAWCTSDCCCASGTCFSTRAPWCCSRLRWACCALRCLQSLLSTGQGYLASRQNRRACT
jgi:hypothetical protein